METRQIILGGGTFEPVRNHFALAAPAFGTTAIVLYQRLPASELFLTRMADRDSQLFTNADIAEFVDMLLLDHSVKVIVMNVAMCDYRAKSWDGVPNGSHATRLHTHDGSLELELEPTEKVIAKIKQFRPDIFLVGFKTTTDKPVSVQLEAARSMQEKTDCDIVLANDTVRRHNVLIDNKGNLCFETSNRIAALQELATLVQLRELVHQQTFVQSLHEQQ